MAGWILWLVVACGFGVGELLSGSGFFLAPFAIGAALAAAAASQLGEVVAAIVFPVTSFATLLAVRPLVTRRLLRGPALRTGGATNDPLSLTMAHISAALDDYHHACHDHDIH